jgi:hypothetical protein
MIRGSSSMSCAMVVCSSFSDQVTINQREKTVMQLLQPILLRNLFR